MKIAERLGVSYSTVCTAFRRHGIERPPRSRKYSGFSKLTLGESLLVPHQRRKGKWYSAFYSVAERLSIGISIGTVDENNVRLTRVE